MIIFDQRFYFLLHIKIIYLTCFQILSISLTCAQSQLIIQRVLYQSQNLHSKYECTKIIIKFKWRMNFWAINFIQFKKQNIPISKQINPVFIYLWNTCKVKFFKRLNNIILIPSLKLFFVSFYYDHQVQG